MYVCLLLLLLPVTYLLKLWSTKSRERKSVTGRHVCITGGSSGIGKSLAVMAVKAGAHVTILARNKERLDETLSLMKTFRLSETQELKAMSVDCTRYEEVEKVLLALDTSQPVYMLVNCAGGAICGTLEDMSVKDIKYLLDINYYASLFPTKALLPRMKERREGIISITGSQCTIFGMYGYAAYASAKYALRGLAESIYMELKDYNVSVTLALPPDTDTPGYENENKSKPLETKLISEFCGVFQPDSVAQCLLNDSLDGKFFSTVGFDCWVTTTLCTGLSPFTCMFDVLVQTLLMGPFRLVMAFYLSKFYGIVTTSHKEKMKEKDT